MKKITRFISLTALLVLYKSAIFAEPTTEDTRLTSVVQTILGRSPALKGFESQIQEYEGGVKEVRATNWPSLSIRSSVTRGDNPVYVFGSLLEQQQFGVENFAIDSLNNPDPLTNFKNALVVGLPIFTGLELQSNSKISRLKVGQTESQLEQTAQNIRLQAVESYLRVLLNQSLVSALSERIDSSKIELENAKKLNARGLVLGSDFYAAQAILSGLETQRLQTQKELEAAHNQLAIMMGRAESTIETKGALSETVYSVSSYDELITRALRQRQELKQAEQQAAMAEVAYKQSGRSFWPKIEAFASIETNTQDFASNPSNGLAGIKSDFPIGDPAYFSRKSKAMAQRDSSKNFQQNLAEQIRIDVFHTYKRYQGAAESLPLAKEMLERAQKSLELFRPLYREGRQSIMEVLRAEENLARAQSSYLETLYQIHSGYARLNLSTGELGPEAVAEIQTHLEEK